MSSDPDSLRLGRLAGLTYLIMIVSAAGGYTTMTRILEGDPSTVAARLADSNAFAIAFAAMALGFLAWVVLAMLLYRLMHAYGRVPGALMIAFTIAGAAMNLLALSQLVPIFGFSHASAGFESLASMRHSYDQLLIYAQIFSGLWMFPFGLLIVRSRIAPRVLGYCLMIGGLGYLLIPVTKFAPHLDEIKLYWVASRAPGIPAMAGEIGVCLWLLIRGARPITASQGAAADGVDHVRGHG